MAKGFQLSIGMVIIIILVIIVLVVVSTFFTSKTGEEITSANAQSIFWNECTGLQQGGCSFIDARDNSDFLQACRMAFSQNDNVFSCLRVHCKCQEVEDVTCHWRALMCEGLSNMGEDDITACCSELRSSCPDEFSPVCP